jgi:hypothetical protein
MTCYIRVSYLFYLLLSFLLSYIDLQINIRCNILAKINVNLDKFRLMYLFDFLQLEVDQNFKIILSRSAGFKKRNDNSCLKC